MSLDHATSLSGAKGHFASQKSHIQKVTHSGDSTASFVGTYRRPLMDRGGRGRKAATRTTMPRSLPQELLDLVFDHLRHDRSVLESCCLVSKSWVPQARRFLFAHIWFISSHPDHPSHVVNTFRALLNPPPVTRVVFGYRAPGSWIPRRVRKHAPSSAHFNALHIFNCAPAGRITAEPLSLMYIDFCPPLNPPP